MSGFVAKRLARSVASLAIILLASGVANAQSTRPATAEPARAHAVTATQATPDLQGVWDFAMRMGERTSPGFFALGPVERGWAGSITMYLTNTLAIRTFTIEGDSVRMVVASREGDVKFQGRLSSDARTMEGIVDYHGGVRVPMIAMRRTQPVAPPVIPR